MDNFSANLVKYRIDKATDELELAQYCTEVHKFSKSLNCSYYAIFHSARALLAIDNLDFKKHSGVISYFIKAYINTTIFDNELGVIIRTAERERNKGDYQDFYVVSKDEAITQFNNAKMFFHKIKTYLEEHYEMEL